MKKIIISTIILILLFIYIVPPYNELNNIMIIDKIKVDYKNNNYNITFREIIPTKNNDNISNKYKYHKVKTNNINKAINMIEKKEKKKLYLSKVKFLSTNINSNLIKDTFKIKHNIIITQ